MIVVNNKPIQYNNKFFNFVVDPYNPLNLPPYTIRLKYAEGVTPTFSKGTGTLVDADENIWDLTYNNGDWSYLLYTKNDLLEVLGANTTGVTSMYCMFQGCPSLITIPLFDTSNLSNASYCFGGCTNVSAGALDLYNQMSTQANPPVQHEACFRRCGRDTQTGSAELAQIPSDWK